MKKVNLYCLLISVLCLIFIWGCGQGTELENSNDSLEVEINLAKSLSVNKQDLKLIGFKTFYVSDENERIKIKELTPIIKEKASNYYIAEDGSFFRVYFPLHTAIVKCNGKIYYADEKGVVKTDDVINLDEVDVAVIGRKRSEYVRGTGTNIIEGDKLFLDKKETQRIIYQIDNLRNTLLKVMDKGGVAVVVEDETLITTYNLDKKHRNK